MGNAKTKNLKLKFNSTLSDEQCLIFSDETKTKQILSNLINNALKFTSEGYIEVGSELWRATTGDENVRIDKGTRVIIKSVRGLTLIVAPEE